MHEKGYLLTEWNTGTAGADYVYIELFVVAGPGDLAAGARRRIMMAIRRADVSRVIDDLRSAAAAEHVGAEPIVVHA